MLSLVQYYSSRCELPPSQGWSGRLLLTAGSWSSAVKWSTWNILKSELEKILNSVQKSWTSKSCKKVVELSKFFIYREIYLKFSWSMWKLKTWNFGRLSKYLKLNKKSCDFNINLETLQGWVQVECRNWLLGSYTMKSNVV